MILIWPKITLNRFSSLFLLIQKYYHYLHLNISLWNCSIFKCYAITFDKKLSRRLKVYTQMFRRPSRFPYAALKVWYKYLFAFRYRSFLPNCFPVKLQLSIHSVVDASMFHCWFCNLAFKWQLLKKKKCCLHGGSQDKLFSSLYLAAWYVPRSNIMVYCTQFQISRRIERFN